MGFLRLDGNYSQIRVYSYWLKGQGAASEEQDATRGAAAFFVVLFGAVVWGVGLCAGEAKVYSFGGCSKVLRVRFQYSLWGTLSGRRGWDMPLRCSGYELWIMGYFRHTDYEYSGVKICSSVCVRITAPHTPHP